MKLTIEKISKKLNHYDKILRATKFEYQKITSENEKLINEPKKYKYQEDEKFSRRKLKFKEIIRRDQQLKEKLKKRKGKRKYDYSSSSSEDISNEEYSETEYGNSESENENENVKKIKDKNNKKERRNR